MNNLTVFKYENSEIRTVSVNGETWLITKDMAEALDYVWCGSSTIKHIPDEWKGVYSVPTPSGIQEMSIISEQGLYFFLGRSDKPKALEFQKWIASEVLPSIRKHGMYLDSTATKEAVESPEEFLARALQLASETLKKREIRLAELEQRNDKLLVESEKNKPKVIFADAVSVSDTTILIGELAKLLKGNGIEIGQNRLFKKLRDLGYLIKRIGTDYNTPTQKAMDLELFKVKETAVSHSDGHVTINKTTKVTGRGQQYFINLFLNKKELVLS